MAIAAFLVCLAFGMSGTDDGSSAQEVVLQVADPPAGQALRKGPQSRGIGFLLVDAESGASIQGAVLTGSLGRSGGEVDAPLRLPVTDGGGVISLGKEAKELWITVSAEGCAKSSFFLQLADVSDVQPQVRLRLWRTTDVTVDVVDSDGGTGIGGADVLATRLPDSDAAYREVVLQAPLGLSTAPTGRATMSLAAGAYTLTCAAQGYDSGISQIVVRSTNKNHFVIKLRPKPPALRGRVLEAWSAKPVAGASVRDAAGAWHLTTDQQGTFLKPHIADFRPTQRWVTVLVSPPDSRQDLAATSAEVYWGDSDVVVLLGSREAQVRVLGLQPSDSPEVAWARMAASGPVAHPEWTELPRNADGLFAVPQSEGDFKAHWLRLSPRLGEPASYRRLQDLPFQDTPQGRVYEWRAPARSDLAITVMGEVGGPLADVAVEVLRSPWGVDAARTAEAVADFDVATSHPLFSNKVGLVAAGRTGPSGGAVLSVPRPDHLLVRCSLAGHRTEIVPLPEHGGATVIMRRSGRAYGVLVGYQPTEPRDLHAVAMDGDWGLGQPAAGSRTRLTSDGRFELQDYLLGRYRIYLVSRDSWNYVGDVEVTEAPGAAVRLVVPRAPAKRQVTFHGRDLSLGDRLIVHESICGAEVAGNVDPRGVVALTLPAGRYFAMRIRPSATGPVCARAEGEIEIQESGARDFELAFGGRPGRVRLMLPGGVAARREVRLLPFVQGLDTLLVSDGDGWLTLENMPPRASLMLVDRGGGSGRNSGVTWSLSPGQDGQAIWPEERRR